MTLKIRAAMTGTALLLGATLAAPLRAQDADEDGAVRAAQASEARAKAAEAHGWSREAEQRAAEAAEHADEAYERATEALDEGQIERAVEAFEGIAASKGRRSDAALYWKAYAQQKRGRRPDALATIERLKKEYPQSRWLKDAQALEIEIRQKGGEKTDVDALADDDLKIAALSGLMGTSSPESLAMLEKLIASGKSARVRQHALFVLSQSGSPRAREIVVATARGQGSPALETKAIEYLGIMGGPENQKALADIYGQSQDLDTRRAVLKSFMISGAKAQVLQVAKTEKQAELRSEAVRFLGVMQGKAELLELYGSETDRDVKESILQGFMIAGDATRLVQIARSEKDPELRKQAVRMLSVMDSKEGRQFLLELLEK